MASPLPSVSISEDDTNQSVESDEAKGPPSMLGPPGVPPPKVSLSVPTPIKSNIGINNPAQGGLFPLPNSQQVAGSARNKVALGKGFSLMDWIRLSKSGKDLTGVGGPRVGGKVREVTRQELRKHRKRKDAWMAINGAVYNVTHYMDYHPGGWDELVRGAGRDATDMFNEIHKWVNYQGLLEACLVGKLVDDPPPSAVKEPPPITPPVLPPIPSKPAPPSMDFFQTDQKITINIYTKRKGIRRDNVIIDNTQDQNNLKILVYLPDKEAFVVHIHLFAEVEPTSSVRVGSSSGKVEVDLNKYKPQKWQGLGNPLENHLWYGSVQDFPVAYRDWTVSSITSVTHDTKHIELNPPKGTVFSVPTGHHVHMKGIVEGMEITRSYTPVTLFKSSTDNSHVGRLHFLIKIYDNGALTPQLGQLISGSKLSVSDHTGTFDESQLAQCRSIYLLAAGTGCTPIFSLLTVLGQKKEAVPTKLLFFNKTQADIIWQEQLAVYQACQPWLSVVHVLSEGEDNWEGERGRVRKDLLVKHLKEAKDGYFAAVCGPKGFTAETYRLLKEVFLFEEEQIHLFQG